MLKTSDNNNGNLIVDSKIDLQNLGDISNRSIEELIQKNHDLLVFPQNLKKYGDAIDRQFIFSLSGNKLTTHNIMGYIGINKTETQLRIASRFDNGRNDYFLHYMLQKVFSINIFDLKFGTDEDTIWNFLLYLFPYFLNKAIRQGLFKTYVRNYYNSVNLKGSVEIERHLRINNPFNGKIAYKIREFSFDNAITQLIRHTIEYIKSSPLGIGVLSSCNETIENVKIIIENTPRFNKNNKDKIISMNIKLLNHPFFMYYSLLQKICLHILRNKKITFGDNKDKIYGLLFDGAWLWEEYLNKVFIDNGLELEHPRNKEKKGGDNLFIGGPRIYPDFIKREKKSNTARYIGDAKYKHKMTREDYYQLTTYMYRYECNKGYLLFPCSENDSLFQYVRVFDGNKRDRKCIELGIKIDQSETMFKEFKENMKKAERKMCECLK